MGSTLEINDTLQITAEQGFPAQLLELQRHRQSPIPFREVEGKIFEFSNKPGVRIFQTDPVRVYLVQNLNGRWLFWGHAFIQEQSIRKKAPAGGPWAGEWVTGGKFIISALYDPAYQEEFTRRESPPNLSYFQ
jgi:hypothetical protein